LVFARSAWLNQTKSNSILKQLIFLPKWQKEKRCKKEEKLSSVREGQEENGMEKRLQDAVKAGGWTVNIDGHETPFAHVHLFNPSFGVGIELGKRPEGYTGPVIYEKGGAVVIPYFRHENGEIWVGLLKKNRPNLGGVVFEASGGFVNPKEEHFEAASREFQEETGISLTPERLGGYTAWNRLFQFCDVSSGEGAGTKNMAELKPELFQLDGDTAVFSDTAPKFFNRDLVFFPWRRAVFETVDDLAGMAIARLVASLM
jgi:8-oxo-dGTP pyrophosphatase MutT (NUDIX family)